MRLNLLKDERKSVTRSWKRRLSFSRLILLLTIALLAVMPATEHFWTWDQFFRIGHDLEFSLLGALIFCGLVALLAQQVVASALFVLLIAQGLQQIFVGRLFIGVFAKLAETTGHFFLADSVPRPPASVCPKPMRI